MKRIDRCTLTHPLHRVLHEKDERELYGANSHDYYAVNHRHRIDKIVRTVKRLQPRAILELGCAQCTIALRLAEAGLHAVAADIDPCMLTYGKLKYERGPFLPVAANAAQPCFRPQRFDCLILAELLEHCADPTEVLTPARDLLASGGWLIITTPNGGSSLNRLPTYAHRARNRDESVRRQFGPDGDDHLFAFTLRELLLVIKKNGFTVQRATTIGNHFLHWKALYHVRHSLPWIGNTFFEALVPALPFVRLRYTHALFVLARKAI